MNSKNNTRDRTESTFLPKNYQDETKKVELKINIPTEVYCQLMRKAQKERKRPEQLVAELVVELSSQKD